MESKVFFMKYDMLLQFLVSQMVDKNFPYNGAIYVRKIGVGIRVMVLNATYGEVYSIQLYVIKFVSEL
jgi:hypothetical protein